MSRVKTVKGLLLEVIGEDEGIILTRSHEFQRVKLYSSLKVGEEIYGRLITVKPSRRSGMLVVWLLMALICATIYPVSQVKAYAMLSMENSAETIDFQLNKEGVVVGVKIMGHPDYDHPAIGREITEILMTSKISRVLRVKLNPMSRVKNEDWSIWAVNLDRKVQDSLKRKRERIKGTAGVYDHKTRRFTLNFR